MYVCDYIYIYAVVSIIITITTITAVEVVTGDVSHAVALLSIMVVCYHHHVDQMLLCIM